MLEKSVSLKHLLSILASGRVIAIQVVNHLRVSAYICRSDSEDKGLGPEYSDLLAKMYQMCKYSH